jgi:uncharacterized cupin superfamily protein
MDVFNLHGEAWDHAEEREGWRSKATRVGHRLHAELIGGGLYELEPGNKLWPYHTHHANEEWVIVVRGQPTLRTPDGEHALREGDVVCFRRGRDGAHQIINRTETPVRVLMLSTAIEPDVVEYLDTGRILAHDATGDPVMFGRPGPPSDYWEGED